mgnify:CR=1 FL=1
MAQHEGERSHQTVIRGDQVVDRTEEPQPREVTVAPSPTGRFRVPARHNQQLSELVDEINADQELQQLWRSANINAIDRSGINDHGPVHIQIVANIGLRLLRLLSEAGVQPSVVANYGLTVADAELVVVLGLALHDIGIAIHREDHEQLSVILAAPLARRLLFDLYSEPTRTIMVVETLHAIAAHHWDVPTLTMEAGVVKVADALDIAKGRSRIPFEAGKLNIHSVSAAAIDSVTIGKGEVRPIKIAVNMNNPAGVYQLDELLKRKLMNSSIGPYVEVSATISAPAQHQSFPVYNL